MYLQDSDVLQLCWLTGFELKLMFLLNLENRAIFPLIFDLNKNVNIMFSLYVTIVNLSKMESSENTLVILTE